MKKMSLGALMVFMIFLVSCEKDDVIVKLSLYDTDYYHKHYVKVDIHNKTGKDIFIPYMGNCISVYYDDIDVTELIRQAESDIDGSDIVLSQSEPDTLQIKGHKYIEGLIEEEFERFLKYNDINSTVMSEEELLSLKNMQIDPFCTFKYFDGVFLKAGELVERYIPIHGLYCDNTGELKNNFSIKFMRHSHYMGLVCDTVSLPGGYKLATEYLDNVAGYEFYANPIKCSDVLYLK